MNYMYATYAGIAPAPCTGDPSPSSLWVVRMESREPTGERMRSNRFGPGVPEPPDPLDRVVEVVHLDGIDNGFPAYAHPGGMQVIGDVLVIALDSANMQAGVGAYVTPTGELIVYAHRDRERRSRRYGAVRRVPAPGRGQRQRQPVGAAGHQRDRAHRGRRGRIGTAYRHRHVAPG